LTTRTDSLTREVQDIQEIYTKEKRELERKLRSAQDETGTLREEAEEARTELSSQERRFKHDLDELQNQQRSLKQNLEALQSDRDEKAEALSKAQLRLSQQETEIGGLENEVVHLKTQTGDAEVLGVIKRELSEQVNHIQKLEATNKEQLAELKQHRKQAKAIEVVEEEKRVLQTRVRMMDDLRRELSEAQLKRQILEDERRSWTAYLENAEAMDEKTNLKTPEDLAKAYIEERLERASLMDQLGQTKAELFTKDAAITSLEEEKSSLQEEVEKHKSAPKPAVPETKSQMRLERQRILAIKEVEFLRAQLKMNDAEEGEFSPEKHDEARIKRQQELEDLVDQYRKEVQATHEALTKAEELSSSHLTQPPPVTPITSSNKRHAASPVEDERLGALTRKNRTLQDSLTQLTTSKSLLEKEFAAARSQLKALKASSRVRVLEMRDNPTSNAEKVKMETLRILKAENEALLQKLGHVVPNNENDDDDHNADEAQDRRPSVPNATLTRLRSELAEKDAAMASKDKHLLRLKQIFASKSLEFREAVASILGWKMDFLPNGRVRVTSMFHPGDTAGAGPDESNSIVFDGEQGTMKVSGGPKSKFASEIRDKIEFWVEGRKEIPCFLAACTLEFWELRQSLGEGEVG